MSKAQRDFILEYYQRELAYLRKEGARFAQKHPKIAKRLELSQSEAADPHVERLLESFAYLTAKIQKEMDDQFPLVGSALLNSLYPQFTNPIPPATVLCFDMSHFKGDMTEPVVVPRHTEVFAEAHDQTECNFQTAYTTSIVPLEVLSAEIVRRENTLLKPHEIPTQRLLRLRMGTLGTPIHGMTVSSLRFYIHAEQHQQDRLYELLFKEAAPVVIEATQDDEALVRLKLPPESLRPVGFAEDESIFPFPETGHKSYRLLLEYFHFQQKFYFFDIQNIPLIPADSHFDLYIGLPDSVLFDVKNIHPATFRLNCTPAVNIFSKTTEPLLFDYHASEYRLIADVRREKTTEIHSIRNVFTLKEGDELPRLMSPYYSFHHTQAHSSPNVLWHVKRTPVLNRDFTGFDCYISFVDESFDPRQPFDQTVYAEVLCTNRDLAQYISSGTLFQCSVEQPAPQIVSLQKPTATVYPPQDGASLWRLIAHLSINHMGFSSDPQSLLALKEILRLYAYAGDGNTVVEAESLVAMQTKTIVRRAKQDAWRGFVHGTQIALTIQDMAQGSMFLLLSILQEFLSAQASINSFVEIQAKRENSNQVWHEWRPSLGGIRLV